MPEPVRRFDQNFLKMSSPQILLETVWDDELTSEMISTFLEKTEAKPRHLGLAAGYATGSAGRLTALAIALGPNVRLIRFRNARESKNLSPGRQLLQDELLCSPDTLLYAFNMAPIALALYKDQRLRLTGAVDIQSGCTGEDDSSRAVADAVKFAVSSTAHPDIYKTNIEAAFKDQSWDDRKSPRLLALCAWLAGFLPSVSDMELRFAEVSRINTLDKPEDQLQVLAQFMRSDQRLDAAKPGSTTHEFTAEGSKNNKFKLQSERFQTRVQGGRGGGPQRMLAEDKYGAKFYITGQTSSVRGRRAEIQAADGVTVEGKHILSVTTVGAGRATMAEQEKDAAILAALQDESETFNNPFLQTIFPNGKEVVWPDNMPTSDTVPPITYDRRPLNDSQQKAVLAMLTVDNSSRITLIQGPPGTGKTTVITAYVHSALEAQQRGIWLIAQSNVAVKNIAEKLADNGIEGWKLLVSKDFHEDWHEHLYKLIRRNMIKSGEFMAGSNLNEKLKGCKVILCTLSMLANPKLNLFTSRVPIRTVVVDEASQIALSGYVAPLKTFSTIQKLCFIGDDKQLPPYGQDQIEEIQSIFEITHLRSQAKFLDTQYRMPVGIGEFISDAMYDGQLLSSHRITTSACWFVDVENSTEKRFGTSWTNLVECEAVCKIAAKLEDLEASYRIISPYDAQRSALENALKANGLDWHNKCYNVDSFQGNEDDHIIVSLVRSKELGFLKDLRRTNVMLSRCKKAMYICSNWDFLVSGAGAKSLVGRMAAAFGDNAWCNVEAIVEGAVEITA